MADVSSATRGALLATIATTNAGWFKAVSPQFLKLIGRPVDALAGVNIADLVHPMQAPAVRRALASADILDEQVINTQLLLEDDEWSPILLVIDRMVDERVNVRLHQHAEAAAVEPEDGQPGDAQPRDVQHRDVQHRDAQLKVAPSELVAPGSASAVTPAVSPTTAPPQHAVTIAPVQAGTPAVAPVHRDDGSDDFPYEDSAEHMAYVARMPADTVPEQRDAVRRSVGTDSTPMLEIDNEGRTTFVRGAWQELSATGASGADVFEEILEASGDGDQILNAIAQLAETATPSSHQISFADQPPMRVRVLPIPSPHLAGVTHALVAVTAQLPSEPDAD